MPVPPLKNVTTPFPAWEPPYGLLRWGVRALVVIVALWAFFSCFTQVPADSVGVLLRFGRYAGTVPPGLRWKMPFGIDQLIVVAVQRQMKLEFGFTTPGYTNRDQGSRDGNLEQSMVTGDLNMALVQWVVQYRIEDPKSYLFQVRDPGETLRDASESVMREVVGDRTVDEVITVGRQDVESETLLGLKRLADRYGLGVSIMQVQLKDVHPPAPVQSSFNEVNQAQQEKQQAINVANGEYNKAVPRARGMAEQKISAAQGLALKRVNEARGDADRFQAQYSAYAKAPEITRQRLYLESMAEVLPQVERKIILDEKAGQLLPLMPLDLTRRGAGATSPR